MAKKKLVRSANKVLAGVCGGIADYFDVDPTLIRVLYAVLSLFSAAFPGLLLIPEAGPNDHYEDAQVVE